MTSNAVPGDRFLSYLLSIFRRRSRMSLAVVLN